LPSQTSVSIEFAPDCIWIVQCLYYTSNQRTSITLGYSVHCNAINLARVPFALDTVLSHVHIIGYVKCAHFIHDSITLTSSEFDVSSDGPLNVQDNAMQYLERVACALYELMIAFDYCCVHVSTLINHVSQQFRFLVFFIVTQWVVSVQWNYFYKLECLSLMVVQVSFNGLKRCTKEWITSSTSNRYTFILLRWLNDVTQYWSRNLCDFTYYRTRSCSDACILKDKCLIKEQRCTFDYCSVHVSTVISHVSQQFRFLVFFIVTVRMNFMHFVSNGLCQWSGSFLEWIEKMYKNLNGLRHRHRTDIRSYSCVSIGWLNAVTGILPEA
ncbi:hypothetical protein T01_2350, partial [Trichinella spiralis]